MSDGRAVGSQCEKLAEQPENSHLKQLGDHDEKDHEFLMHSHQWPLNGPLFRNLRIIMRGQSGRWAIFQIKVNLCQACTCRWSCFTYYWNW
jgi:hypothetical protein